MPCRCSRVRATCCGPACLGQARRTGLERLRGQPRDPPLSWTTDCAARRGPCESPAPRPRPGPSRRQRSRACGRTPAREGWDRRPTAPPTPRVDDGLQQRSPSTRAVVGCVHVEHVQLPRPRRRSVQGRARHGDPDQLAIPLGDSRPVLAISLVGQRGSPEPLPSSQEARIIEHRIRHEPPIRLLPAPHIYTRHLRNVLDPGRANSQRGTHRRIVGRDQMLAPPDSRRLRPRETAAARGHNLAQQRGSASPAPYGELGPAGPSYARSRKRVFGPASGASPAAYVVLTHGLGSGEPRRASAGRPEQQ